MTGATDDWPGAGGALAPFVYDALPARIVFGPGRLDDLGAELARLGAARALVLCTPQQRGMAEDVADRLGGAAVFDGAAMHTPVEVTARALEALRAAGADALVAVGGGSTTGLAKALALRTDLPQIAVPTTYAGSEVTPILGETEAGVKTTQRTPKVLPETVIYDPALTLGLPVGLSVTSGINAVAHAVEALYARDRNPIIDMLAREGIAAFAAALPRIVAAPEDLEARTRALYGAWLCGTCLGAVGMSLHHKLCHVLGGSFDLPHAETHTVVLPHAVAYNAPAAPEAMAAIAAALGAEDAAVGLFSLAKGLGAPTSLAAIGMPEGAVDRAVELALRNPYWNPRPVEADPLRRLIGNAWHGRAPGS